MKRIGRMVDVLHCFECMEFMERIVERNIYVVIDFLLKILLRESLEG